MLRSQLYTVIGLHDQGEGNRFCETYEACSPGDAITQAQQEYPGLYVAGVARGAVKMVDEGTNGGDAR